MFAVEDEFGFTMLEADERVLPITYVIAKTDVEDNISEVVAVEVEPEGIDYSVPFVHGNKYGWSITPSAVTLRSNARSRSRPTSSAVHQIWIFIEFIGDVLLSTKPVWPLFYVVIARQVNVAALLKLIQVIQIRQIRILQPTLDRRVIQFGCDVEEVLGDVAWPKLLFRI